MKYRGTAALAFLVCGCTSANPYYVGESSADGSFSLDGGERDGAQGQPDQARARDFAAACSDGQRSCGNLPQRSEVCAAGEPTADRACPAASSCVSGYCQAPPMTGGGDGQPCDQNTTGMPLEGDCTNFTTDLSCQPFVDPADKMVAWVCARHVGPGLPGDSCTSGKTCRSGFCGANGTCFRGCLLSTDCPNNGKLLKCAPVAITVEGVMVTAGSCIPAI